ncbi:MAG: lysozyme inhibitor LprI family protein [Cyanobacteria bacterium P01_H01_bin.21]
MGKSSYKQFSKLLCLVLFLGLVSCRQSQQTTSTDSAAGDTPTAPSAEESDPAADVSDAQPEVATTSETTATPAEAPRPSPVALAKKDCGQADTQLDMNQCAAENYTISDKALNQVYQAVLQDLDDTTKAQLTTAEERWIVFRDAQCAFESGRFEGGSMAPFIQATCMEQITDNRIAELQQSIKAETSFTEADAQLNEVYQAVQALATETQGETLTDVQLTWLDYRDAHCEYEANLPAATDVQACLAAITETRVWQLQTLQEEWSL